MVAMAHYRRCVTGTKKEGQFVERASAT